MAEETTNRLQLKVGDTLGDNIQPDRFTIRQKLGQGAHGEVYLAQDSLYQRPVALKFLLLGETEVEQIVAINEARSLARIRHPNVVTVYEVIGAASRSDGQQLPPLLLMEYIEGGELQEVLRRRKKGMEPGEALRVMRPVAAALVAAHRAGVLHRDLKPGNIMLGEDGVVKLIDFGVAQRGLDPQEELFDPAAMGSPSSLAGVLGSSGSGSPGGRGGQGSSGAAGSEGSLEAVVGTPYFLAPELWAGADADRQTDIYAFGVTFFRTLTLHYPTREKDEEALQQRMLSGESLPGVREVRAEVPVGIAEVVDRALCVDRSERYQTADDLLQALDQAARHGSRLLPEAPYVGLNTFTASEQGVFFGREEEIARLSGRLRRDRVVTLMGESGAGKSSLVLAGVGPAVEAGELDDGVAWQISSISPGRRPLEALAGAVAEFTGRKPQELSRELTEDPVRWRGLLGGLRRGRRQRGPRRGLLLVVDQLEELVTVCEDSQAQEQFGRAMESALNTSAQLRVVLTVRSDFLPRLATVAGLARPLEAIHLVRPLDGEALRATVVSPARAFGYSFESEAMVDEIVSQVAGRPGSLPLLQFALAQLWRRRDRDQRIVPRSALQRMGGVGGALARTAEQVYSELASLGMASLTDRILLELLTPDGTKRQRHLADLLGASTGGLEPLPELPAKWSGLGQELTEVARRAYTVVERLREARLVVGQQDSLELAHEALAVNWQHMKRLVEQTRAAREIAGEAEHAARRWDSHGRPREMLWRGQDLHSAAALIHKVDAHGVQLPPLASRFVVASLASQRRGRWTFRGGVLLVLLLAAAGTAIFVVKLSEERDLARAASARAGVEEQRAKEALKTVALALQRAEKAEKKASKASVAATRSEAKARESEAFIRTTVRRVIGKQKPDARTLLELARHLARTDDERKKIQQQLKQLEQQTRRLRSKHTKQTFGLPF